MHSPSLCPSQHSHKRGAMLGSLSVGRTPRCHPQLLSAAALLFRTHCVFACSDVFIYSPPSLANFSARIAFIHESPPFLSLTRARSHCRREEARTLFPLFKVTRLVPGPGGQHCAPAHPPCLVFRVRSPQPPPPAGRHRALLPTWNLMDTGTPTLSAGGVGAWSWDHTSRQRCCPPGTACRVWAFLAGMGGEVSAGRRSSAGSAGVM